LKRVFAKNKIESDNVSIRTSVAWADISRRLCKQIDPKEVECGKNQKSKVSWTPGVVLILQKIDE